MENIPQDLLEITLKVDNSLQLTHIWGPPCSIPVPLLQQQQGWGQHSRADGIHTEMGSWYQISCIHHAFVKGK